MAHFSQALEKLNRQLAEAEAEVEARKRPPEDTGPKIVGEGLVIDEWVSCLATTLNSYVQCSGFSFQMKCILETSLVAI